MNIFNIIEGHLYGTNIIVHVSSLIFAFIFFLLTFYFTKHGSIKHIIFGILWFFSIIIGIGTSFTITSINPYMEYNYLHLISIIILITTTIGIISLLKNWNKKIHKYCFLISNCAIIVLAIWAIFDENRIIKKIYIIFTNYL